MNGFLRSLAPFGAVLLATACSANGGSPSALGAAGQSVPMSSHSTAETKGARYALQPNVRRACFDTRPGYANCLALVRTDAMPNVSGFGPSDLASAYNMPTTGGTGQVVAIVDAFDNPNVTSDLAEYRSNFGLPAANFTKYNQEGQTSGYPEGNSGWGVEIDLDVEMVSAACPNCTIILVEANNNSNSNLGLAVDEAVKLGATVVSNSYSGGGSTESDYDHKGVTILASAGDSGYGISDPADFPSVVAVGGTHLVRGGGGRGWTETVWSGTGGGCSTKTKPKWQHDTGCTFRTANDVAAVADPNTGVAEYDTYGENGWFVVGGTSVSSPYLGGVFGLAGNSTKQDGGKTFYKKKHQTHLYDITSGNDGSCNPSYLCTAGPGYDGPTGWGTPNGTGAF